MSTPQGGQATPAAKDTFLKSLEALKQTLLIDSPIKRRLNQDVDQRLYEERQAYEKKINEQKVQIELLDKKLAESASKAEREQSLRATLEKIESATKELNAQLKETGTSNTPLESKIAALEADMKKQEAASKGEKIRFDQQTNASTKEKEEASTKHDAIAARLLAAQNLTQELTTNLAASLKSLVDEKAHHKDFVRGLENANKILVKAMESGKAAKEIIAKEVSRMPSQVMYCYCLSYLLHSLTCILILYLASFIL
jgi:chromosome segregation ATPase